VSEIKYVYFCVYYPETSRRMSSLREDIKITIKNLCKNVNTTQDNITETLPFYKMLSLLASMEN